MNYDKKIEANAGDEEVVVTDAPQEEPELGKRFGTKFWLVALAVLAAVVAIWFVVHALKEPEIATEASDQVPVVTVVQPGRANVEGQMSVTGTLGARRRLPVGSVGEGGRVESVRVDAGDWVKQGQVLAVIDRSVQSQQVASQAAQVDVAQADARLAQSNLDRALQLVDRGFISKADVDRLTSTRDAAVARVRVAQATLAQLRANTARLNIVAPAAGLVLERNVEPGQVVSGGSNALFAIARDGAFELAARVNESDLAQLAVGVPATVTPVGSSQSFDGEVWQIAPVIDETSRQGIARIALDYSPQLRPGGFASATIGGRAVTAPVLPDSAIQNDDKGAFVYVVGNDGKAHRRAVRTGLVTAQGIIVAEGLNGTEKVVLRAGGFLNPGERVNPVAQKD